MQDRIGMQHAIQIAQAGIRAGQSPFGAAIVTKAGELVAAAHNTVRATCDPTAHAEVNCIRLASRNLGTIDLTGLRMYTTCEPCPMCASAVHWSRLAEVIFGATIEDAAAAGFNELYVPCTSLYEQGKSQVIVRHDVLSAECADLFAQWKRGPQPVPY